MDNVPHLALPLRIVGGSYTAVQQDTLDEVRTTVACIVSFPLGYREERPDFGIKDPEFQERPIDTLDVERACEEWEPRATVTVTEEPYDPRAPGDVKIRIAVSMAGAEDYQEA